MSKKKSTKRLAEQLLVEASKLVLDGQPVTGHATIKNGRVTKFKPNFGLPEAHWAELPDKHAAQTLAYQGFGKFHMDKGRAGIDCTWPIYVAIKVFLATPLRSSIMEQVLLAFLIERREALQGAGLQSFTEEISS